MKYQEQRILFFDGVCNLCNGFVDFLIKHDSKKELYYASLQSDIAIEVLGEARAKALKSVVFFDRGKVYENSEAAIRALAYLFPSVKIGLLIPRFIRDGLYHWVAKNRYRWFGRRSTCRLPTDAEKSRLLG